ncbi:hypothetical protein ACI78Q_06050 [Geodermatophilus sp. SYSU D00705]
MGPFELMILLVLGCAFVYGVIDHGRNQERKQALRAAAIDVATVGDRYVVQCSQCGPSRVGLVSAMMADQLRLDHMRQHGQL